MGDLPLAVDQPTALPVGIGMTIEAYPGLPSNRPESLLDAALWMIALDRLAVDDSAGLQLRHYPDLLYTIVHDR